MTTAQIKQHLHEFIETAGDKKLKAMYTLLQQDETGDYDLSDMQKAELDRRLFNYESGLGQSFIWDDALDSAGEALKKTRV